MALTVNPLVKTYQILYLVNGIGAVVIVQILLLSTEWNQQNLMGVFDKTGLAHISSRNLKHLAIHSSLAFVLSVLLPTTQTNNTLHLAWL